MNTQTTHQTKQTTKLSILLLAATAAIGLFAAACGAGQASTVTTVSPAQVVEFTPTTVAPTTTAKPAPRPSTVGETGSDEDVPCYAQRPADETAVKRQAEALLAEVQTLFPTLSQEQAGNLAFSYVQCGITAADVKAVLAEGALGDQYRRMVEALKAGSYQNFLDTYKAQPCLLAAHDFGTKIKSATKLKELISAVSGAAYIQFEPSIEELETIAQNLATDLMSSFQNAMENGGEADDHLDENQPVTCEQFAKLVAQQLAAS